MRRLDKSIGALVDSYSAYGLVNHPSGPIGTAISAIGGGGGVTSTGGANLPSRKSVEGILRGLDQVIFPGFREQDELDHDNLRLLTAERVNRLARELVREVEKSLTFGLKSGVLSCGNQTCHAAAELIVDDFFDELPAARAMLALDMEAAFRGDPAAKSPEEVIVSYPGFYAITVHRLAHFFWERQVPLIPRMMSEVVHGRTGIDIHPGATIGESFFIDHGTGVVIGETTVIGRNVKLYQGVTLGALSVRKEEADRKRHPTIEDDVTIYSGATILGGRTVIGRGSTIGGNVWVTSSVPPNTLVYNKTGEHLMREQ